MRGGTLAPLTDPPAKEFDGLLLPFRRNKLKLDSRDTVKKRKEINKMCTYPEVSNSSRGSRIGGPWVRRRKWRNVAVAALEDHRCLRCPTSGCGVTQRADEMKVRRHSGPCCYCCCWDCLYCCCCCCEVLRLVPSTRSVTPEADSKGLQTVETLLVSYWWFIPIDFFFSSSHSCGAEPSQYRFLPVRNGHPKRADWPNFCFSLLTQILDSATKLFQIA